MGALAAARARGGYGAPGGCGASSFAGPVVSNRLVIMSMAWLMTLTLWALVGILDTGGGL